MEASVCSPSIDSMQKRLSRLGLGGSAHLGTMQSVSVTIGPTTASTVPTEPEGGLASFSNEPKTPSTSKELRPVSTPLPTGRSEAGKGQGLDSGYSSIASSPKRTLIIVDKPIPSDLTNRFHDLKRLYSEDLLKAVYKKNVGQRDISMKLKYLGKDESSAQLYIVVQCEEQFAKKVKKFFAKDNVVEDLRQDFKVHVVKKALQRLATLKVYGKTAAGQQTFCGRPITISNGEASVFATLGGLILVSMNNLAATPILCGLTAAHSITSLSRNDAGGSLPSFEDDNSESSDERYDEPDEDEEILFNELNADYPNLDLDPFREHKVDHLDFYPFRNGEVDFIGTIIADSIEQPANHDWALIGLETDKWLPNRLPKPVSSKHRKDHQRLYGYSVRKVCRAPTEVSVITSHGIQKGTLESNESSLLVAPGAKFVETFDLKLSGASKLRPGDSGSWVVEESTGEVIGSVISIDAFGEVCVIPIQDMLEDIRSHLAAAAVELPTESQIRTLQAAAIVEPTLGLTPDSNDSGYYPGSPLPGPKPSRLPTEASADDSPHSPFPGRYPSMGAEENPAAKEKTRLGFSNFLSNFLRNLVQGYKSKDTGTDTGTDSGYSSKATSPKGRHDN